MACGTFFCIIEILKTRINIKIIDNLSKEAYNKGERGESAQAGAVNRKRGRDMIDWIIGIVIAAAVISVIVKKVKDAKAGKSGCGCGCSGCASKDQCH